MDKEIMQEFTNQFGFIIFFLSTALLISMFFSEKILYGYLILIFLGQLVMNADKVGSLVKKF